MLDEVDAVVLPMLFGVGGMLFGVCGCMLIFPGVCGCMSIRFPGVCGCMYIFPGVIGPPPGVLGPRFGVCGMPGVGGRRLGLPGCMDRGDAMDTLLGVPGLLGFPLGWGIGGR